MAVNGQATTRAGAGASGRGETARRRRFKYGLNAVVLVGSLLVILAVVNWFAVEASWRADLTSRGLYSLSPQTTSLLQTLDEPVELTLVFVPEGGTYQRQVEDVLREFQARSDSLEVERIDPTNPRTIAAYEELIERLKVIFGDEIAAYEQAIQVGRERLAEVTTRSQSEAQGLEPLLASMPREHPRFGLFQQIYLAWSRLPLGLDQLTEELDAMLETAPEQGKYFGDWQAARSTLSATLSRAADNFHQIATLYQQSLDEGGLPDDLAQALPAAVARLNDFADRLTQAQETLDNLDPLGLTPIVRELRTSNCVLLTSSDNAVVLGFNELFPAPSAQEQQSGEAVDRRFAGERVIAGGIRRLLLDEQPVVVLVHAESRGGVLMPAPDGSDLGAVAQQLRDLGYEVREWNTAQTPERPVVDETALPPVWVILPPAPSFQSAGGGAQVAAAARSLVEDGQNVLVSLWPSLIPGFGQEDQWNEVLAPFDLRADSGRIVVELIPQPGAQDIVQPMMDLQDYESGHPIADALSQQPTRILFPVPLELTADEEETEDDSGESTSAVQRWVLLAIEPGPRVWAESNLLNLQEARPPDEPATEPYPVVVAAERGLASRTQRIVVVGSPALSQRGWASTGIVQALALGPGGLLPAFPGNAELFTSSVLWLSDLDALIAPSPWSQRIARIDDLSPTAELAWRWSLIAGLPAACFAAGIGVWWMRRG